MPMSFSSFMALPMSPLIFILPLMKAAVGFRLPANILSRLSVSMVNVTSGAAPSGGSPLPTLPAPFFKSTKKFSPPLTWKRKRPPVWLTSSVLSFLPILCTMSSRAFPLPPLGASGATSGGNKGLLPDPGC
uniref:Putative secreted protein n=1 Tax=Ixodes ricinus TaxID=34613 RepID=A0A6B0UQW6_IXORI